MTIDMNGLQPELNDVQKLFMAVTTVSTALHELKTDFAHDHKILIEGNGDLPLTEQVRNLNNFVNGIKSLGKVLIGAIIVQTVAFGGTVIWAFFKMYPVLTKLADGTYIIVQK